MRSALLLVALLPWLMLVGCFNPDYSGPGGFTCAQNDPCPEGYVCTAGVCRPEGVVAPDAAQDAGAETAADSTSPTETAPDAALDGPAIDGPAIDGPAIDGPAKSDISQPDAAKLDAAKPDAAKPDAAKPDAAKPDTLSPDTLSPDTGSKPTCGYDEVVASGVSSHKFAIDVALDSAGGLYVFYLNSTGTPLRSTRTVGVWSAAAIGNVQARTVAAAIDTNDVQHVVYLADAAPARAHYTHMAKAASSWSTPVQVSATADLGDELDVGAAAKSFVLLSRNTVMGSEASLYALNQSTGTKFVWQEASAAYSEPRIALWNKVATSISDNSATWWRLSKTSVIGTTPVTKVFYYPSDNKGVVCPAPVAVDKQGYIQMVQLASSLSNSGLSRTIWTGDSTKPPNTMSTTASAFGCEIDLATDGKSLPHVVYTSTVGANQGALVWRHQSSSGAWSNPATIAAKADTVARLAIDATNKRVYVVYRGFGTNASKLYTSCRTY